MSERRVESHQRFEPPLARDRRAASATLRVLVVEPYGIERAAIACLLRAAGFAVVGEAADAAGAVARCAALMASGVDLVLSTFDLPDADGFALAGRLKERWPALRVVAVGRDGDAVRLRALDMAGADGYVLKQEPPEALLAALRTAARGELACSPAVARALLAAVRHPVPAEPLDPLTPREREILALVATGLTSKEAARRLGLSTKTVENHRAQILHKLGVANAAAAVARTAAEAGG